MASYGSPRYSDQDRYNEKRRKSYAKQHATSCRDELDRRKGDSSSPSYDRADSSSGNSQAYGDSWREFRERFHKDRASEINISRDSWREFREQFNNDSSEINISRDSFVRYHIDCHDGNIDDFGGKIHQSIMHMPELSPTEMAQEKSHSARREYERNRHHRGYEPSPDRDKTDVRRRRSRDGCSRSPRHTDRNSSRSNESYSDEITGCGGKYSRTREEYPDERDHERRSSDSRERDQRSRHDDRGYADEADSREHRPRRRRRNRNRGRDRRSRESDRDRRHQDSDRSRHQRERDRDGEQSPKEVPWVPPPLPEHLRHLTQVPWVSNAKSSSTAVPPPVPPPVPQVQNQFQNDGSFMEMFRKQMEAANPGQQSEDLNQSDAIAATNTTTASSGVSVPAVAPVASNSCGVPVIARRRISKILKTGVVKKPKKAEEKTAGPEAKGSDAWSRYMNEVQKYRANKCIEDESCRPLMK